MFGFIILRDIPKIAARIDLLRFPIQGGFRGFSMVPPGCWHYVSVESSGEDTGFWCWLNPNEAVVKRFTPEVRFVNEEEETAQQFTTLARQGAMGQALQPYLHQHFGAWFGLVSYLDQRNFPPTLHEADGDGSGSRFARAFQGTHGGNAQAFLAEFQYAFVAWLVSQTATRPDDVALARWRHLLLSAYNAGENDIRAAGDLFANLVDLLLRHFALLPDDYFAPDTWLTAQAGYMIEDMADTGVESLVTKSQTLAEYLSGRRS